MGATNSLASLFKSENCKDICLGSRDMIFNIEGGTIVTTALLMLNDKSFFNVASN